MYVLLARRERDITNCAKRMHTLSFELDRMHHILGCLDEPVGHVGSTNNSN